MASNPNSVAIQQMRKGDELMEEGRKALTKGGFASFFTSKEDKFEKAVEAFDKAGNAYKTAKAWAEAGSAFTEAAACYKSLGQQGDAAKKLTEAGESLQKAGDAAGCVDRYRQAVAVYLDAGRWNQCGNVTKTIAEMFEAGVDNGLASEGAVDTTQEAIAAYQQASEYYSSESPPRTQAANQCLEKVAQLCSAAGETKRAADIFENIGRDCLGNKLLKFNARAYMLKCLVCHLAGGDAVQVQQKLAEFGQLDYTLAGSREEKFIREILASVAGNNAEAFGMAAAEFNSIKKIDPWMTSLLLQCKRGIVVESVEEVEEVDEEGLPVQAAAEEEDLS